MATFSPSLYLSFFFSLPSCICRTQSRYSSSSSPPMNIGHLTVNIYICVYIRETMIGPKKLFVDKRVFVYAVADRMMELFFLSQHLAILTCG